MLQKSFHGVNRAAEPVTSMQPLEPRRLLSAPDLAVEFGTMSYNPDTGEIDTVSTINNFGDATPAGPYTMKWFLSRDEVVNNADDVTLKTATLSNAPTAGNHIQRSDRLFVPYSTPFGAWFIGFAVDVDNTIAEPNDLNNFQFSNGPIIGIAAQTIDARGTPQADTISVTPSSDAQGRPVLVATVNGQSTRTNPFRTSSITILSFDGDDSISIDKTITNAVYVDGGNGRDTIQGGGGDDTLKGGSDPDIIRGGPGNDRINGNGSSDTLFGEQGKDRMYGNGGSDFMDGGSSADRLDGGAGRDTMLGQGGNDAFFTRDGVGGEIVSGGSGVDRAKVDPQDVLSSIQTMIP